jgi:hypothetical protein
MSYGKRDGVPRWRRFSETHNTISEEGWFSGLRIMRVKTYGTLSNKHVASRWRISGYVVGDRGFDLFGDALNFAKNKSK